MEKIATLLRFMQLYSHAAHNLIGGETFFQDHEFFGELYPAYEADYDSVVERMIGLDMKPDVTKINSQAVGLLDKNGITNTKAVIEILMKAEKMLCMAVEKEITPNPMSHPHGGKDLLSQGTVQLIGEICNKSEMRQYKMKQRSK